MSDVMIGLADAVRELRRELTEALAEAEDKPVRFELGPVEMEFLLELGKSGEGNAGVRFWVVSLGGKGSVTAGSTHRVKLSLTPKDHRGGVLLAADPLEADHSAGTSAWDACEADGQ
jgi:hypothetical protein